MKRRGVLGAGGAVVAGMWLSGCTDKSGRAQGAPGGTTAAGGPATTRAATATENTPSAKATATAGPGDWKGLAGTLHGDLVRPQDAAYATARRLYNTRFDTLRPAGIAYATGTADIRACLKFARDTGTRPSIRSGGHSYAGFSSGDGRLVIDVSRLNSVRVGADGVAEIGAGAKLIDVYSRLGAQGRTIPGGSCPSVGISGLTLGGGHGVVSRSMGLTCDNLVGATMVTADGQVHEVSASSDPELLWGLRGGGNGQFGVVTALRFRTRPVPSGVVTGYLTWPWSRAAAVVRAWQQWGPDQPDAIWSSLHLDCAAGGAPTVSVPMMSTGSYAGLSAAADALAAAVGSHASSVTLRRHGYIDAMFAYAGCSGLTAAQCHLAPNGRLGRETYTARSDFYTTDLPAAGIDTMLGRMEHLPRISGTGSASIALTALGGAVGRLSPTATAFPHRGARFLAQYIASDRLTTASWLTDTHAAVRRWASGGAYANYTDPTLTSWRTAYYGPNVPRLTALKHRLDPGRLFDFPQAL